MKSSLAVVAVTLTVAIAGCENRAKAPASPPASAAPAAADRSAPTPQPTSPPVAAPTPTQGTPAFAAVYPKGQIEGDPLVAAGSAGIASSGAGGVVTFTTTDAPDAVVAFYRQRAEAAGLSPMMSLNTGDTRGYGAIRQDTGASVNVVASPVEGRTSVQLTWSAGQ